LLPADFSRCWPTASGASAASNPAGPIVARRCSWTSPYRCEMRLSPPRNPSA
jgi:hypothetical protein